MEFVAYGDGLDCRAASRLQEMSNSDRRQVESSSRFLYELSRCNHPPCLAQVRGKLGIINLIEMDPYPSTHSDIWWMIELFRSRFYKRSLKPERYWADDSDSSVIVMVVRKHREDLLMNKESRFSV
jgi:hypothetical protein